MYIIYIYHIHEGFTISSHLRWCTVSSTFSTALFPSFRVEKKPWIFYDENTSCLEQLQQLPQAPLCLYEKARLDEWLQEQEALAARMPKLPPRGKWTAGNLKKHPIGKETSIREIIFQTSRTRFLSSMFFIFPGCIHLSFFPAATIPKSLKNLLQRCHWMTSSKKVLLWCPTPRTLGLCTMS